ncbi:hypothetical protein ACOSP7_007961 [Xanthoceras sorbifolium]
MENTEGDDDHQDLLEEVTILKEQQQTIVDFNRLQELTNYTNMGTSKFECLVKHWEHTQANAACLLREGLKHNLSEKRQQELLMMISLMIAQPCTGSSGRCV